jgi:hypothetical protein
VSARGRAGRGAAVAVIGLGLCWLYLRQARTIWVTSDGASNALQAWDMLHGNLLLHGWWLSDVTFYTTELPEYMLVEAARGLTWSVIWTAAAITYTLLVALTGLLAAGPPGTQHRVMRGLLAAGIVLAPSSTLGTPMLLSSPDHTGTSVPLLLTLLVIDWDRSRSVWIMPVLVGGLLAWTQVADQVAVFAGALPVAIACGLRFARGAARGGAGRGAGSRTDLVLALAAVASVPVAQAALRAIRAFGGFYVHPVVTNGAGLFAPLSQVPYHARVLAESLAVIFGANYFDQWSPVLRAIAVAHLVGAAVVLIGLAVAARLLLAGRLDRVSQVLLAAIAVLLAAGLLGAHLTDILAAHEIAVIAPFGAALAGRALGGRLGAVQLGGIRLGIPLLGAGLAASLGFLAYDGSLPPYGAGSQPVANWLVAHHMGNGVAGYWQADVMTLATGGRETVAPVWLASGAAYRWEAKADWYARPATYAISPPKATSQASPALARAAFGPPARVYHVHGWVIQVWHRDLLAAIHHAGTRRRSCPPRTYREGTTQCGFGRPTCWNAWGSRNEPSTSGYVARCGRFTERSPSGSGTLRSGV